MTDLLDFLLSTFRSAADAGPAALGFLILGVAVLVSFLGLLVVALVRGPGAAWAMLRDSWREASDEVEEEHRQAREEIEAEAER